MSQSFPPGDIFDCYSENTGILGFANEDFNTKNLNRFQRNLINAKNFHNQLQLYCHPKTCEVALNGLKTQMSINLKKNYVTAKNLLNIILKISQQLILQY